MSHRIDQLFKNKLGDHSLTPRADAWDKIQAGTKKNRPVIYWRAAAAILFAGLLVFTWYLLSSPAKTTGDSLTQAEDIKIQEPTGQPRLHQQPTPKSSLAQTDDKSAAVIMHKNMDANRHPVNLQPATNHQMVTETISEPDAPNENADLQSSLIVAETKTDKAIVIEFSLPAISIVQPAEAVASDTPTDKPGILKFLETARDVKNGDATFETGLHTIKNELLAFDLKKDKTRRN